VEKAQPASGVIPASPAIQILANSFVFHNSFGMAIDASGNLFLPGGSALSSVATPVTLIVNLSNTNAAAHRFNAFG
jgi:hypothetical protein